jgi:hypothetical protein
MSFEDLQEGIAEMFDEWAPDVEAAFHESYQRTLSKSAQRRRESGRRPRRDAEKLREYRKTWYLNMRADPERYAEFRRKRSEWQRQQLANLSPSDREEYLLAARVRGALSRAAVREDPVLYDAKKRRDREYQRVKGVVLAGPVVTCGCGCGATFSQKKGARKRSFLPHHAPRLRGTTKAAVLSALAKGPLFVGEIAIVTGKGKQVVCPALSKLRRDGKVENVGEGMWCLK